MTTGGGSPGAVQTIIICEDGRIVGEHGDHFENAPVGSQLWSCMSRFNDRSHRPREATRAFPEAMINFEAVATEMAIV